MTIASLPQLPLVCLKTADFKDTQEVVKGKNTIIDFWTTKCTRCPDALDKFDDMAKDPKYENVQFVSICCDKLDGARDIIERDEDLRWQNVNHYFMNQKDKEEAKKILGFKSVPFYVVLDEDGSIQQKGNSKSIDFGEVPGVVRPEPESRRMPSFTEEKKDDDEFAIDFQLDFSHQKHEPVLEDRVFCLDDDF
eukprot:scaffold22642_cov134-Cylindrotheca_fusiformis.AAC.28